MENLEISNKPFSAIRFGLGIFMVVTAVTWLIIFINSHHVFDMILCLFFIFYGLYNMTNGFGIEKLYISVTENGLKIKWMDWVRAKMLSDSQVENIKLGRNSITISRKESKSVKLKLGYMETKQKSEIYNFFIDYASAKNLLLIRDFEKAKTS